MTLVSSVGGPGSRMQPRQSAHTAPTPVRYQTLGRPFICSECETTYDPSALRARAEEIEETMGAGTADPPGNGDKTGPFRCPVCEGRGEVDSASRLFTPATP